MDNLNFINNLINEVVTEQTRKVVWPEKYFNRKHKRFFVPQNAKVAEKIFECDTPRHIYFMSGEGAGKTASLAVLTLEKLRRGLSGAFVCVNLPMLIKVWDEFKQWIPWECVIEEHRYMGNDAWTPYRSIFEIVFMSEIGGTAKLVIGGLGDDYGRWESLNLNFFVLDETRHIPHERIMKIVTGRIRITGPNGEPPQVIVGSTPTDTTHWMYDWFGPLLPENEDDPYRPFKLQSEIIKLTVEANLHNLSPDYIEMRGLGLTEAEKPIYIQGEWGDPNNDNKFLDSMDLWYRLHDPDLQPPRLRSDPRKDWSDALVLGMDGAIKNDSFALVAVSRNPKNRLDIAVRLVREFKPVNGRINFAEVEAVIRQWCRDYNIVTVVFDIYQIYDMTERLRKEGVAWFQEFSQTNKRTLADNFLFELIVQSRIAHRGDQALIEHLSHAGTKYDAAEKKRRIVKTRETRKIDLVIALAMAAWECSRLNL